MKTKKKASAKQAFEEALADRSSVSSGKCLLRLYVAGASARSNRAILSARKLCDSEFNGKCKLEVIDVYQQPILARDEQILATPTLVRELPRPVRRIIGDLSNSKRLFIGLDLHAKTRTAH